MPPPSWTQKSQKKPGDEAHSMVSYPIVPDSMTWRKSSLGELATKVIVSRGCSMTFYKGTDNSTRRSYALFGLSIADAFSLLRKSTSSEVF